MNQLKFRIPVYVRNFLLKMGVLMLIFTLCRIIFFIRNYAYFPNAGLPEFITGLWFDLVTLSVLSIPMVAIELFPLRNRRSKLFNWAITIISLTLYFPAVLINLVDVEYFAFTAARSTSGLFVMLGFGSDLKQQLPSYFSDYWYLFSLLVVIMAFGTWLIKRGYKQGDDDSPDVKISRQLVIYSFALALTIFIGRGGPIYKPIVPAHASKYTESQNVQLVLNSAFTVINSWGNSAVEEKEYLSNQEAAALYNPIHKCNSHEKIQGQNVVIIILESFSIEFINSLNVDEQDWTPFFDELVDSSLVFTNAFANGKKSVDAVSSIVSSIPKFMNQEYLLSSYSMNEIQSLPSILKKEGYETAFFHGATNGSMHFDAFSFYAGYDQYFGRTEYNNDQDFDGSWGIYDEEFMKWSVEEFSKLKEPFFTTLFTISSHTPYNVPAPYKEKFEDSPSDKHRAIQYTDCALRAFFEKAKQEPWYERTLFILTADHTPGSDRRIYLHERGQMNVPMVFYHSSDTFFRGRSDRVMGHIDIMPTLLDLCGYKEKFFSFGHSVFDTIPGFTFCEVGSKKMLFEQRVENPHLLVFQNDQSVALYDLLDLYQDENVILQKPEVAAAMEKKIKAILQIHNHVMIHNKMTVDNFSR